MKRDLDCRGLLGAALEEKVRKALERTSRGTVKVTVDSPGAQEAVSALAVELCCKTKVEEIDGTYFMWLTRESEKKKCSKEHRGRLRSLLVYLTSDSIGEGELGRSLMSQFISTLKETGPLPDRIICINTAVFLTSEGSPVLDLLKELEDMGVDIFSSEKSLDHYRLTDKLSVGSRLNMFDIIASFAEAEIHWRP
jgi:selenium metabolism protein YedF